MKRTFVVPDEKEAVYEKFKSLVPEVSSKLVEFIEEYVNKQEAVSEQIAEQTIYNGIDYVSENIFKGDTVKFYGVSISIDLFLDTDFLKIYKRIFLTKKGKFLLYSEITDIQKGEIKYTYDEPYDSYFDMKEKAELSNNLISQCEAYLEKNSVVRTFKMLDV